jgi:hypothetical protein
LGFALSSLDLAFPTSAPSGFAFASLGLAFASFVLAFATPVLGALGASLSFLVLAFSASVLGALGFAFVHFVLAFATSVLGAFGATPRFIGSSLCFSGFSAYPCSRFQPGVGAPVFCVGPCFHTRGAVCVARSAVSFRGCSWVPLPVVPLGECCNSNRDSYLYEYQEMEIQSDP